VLASLNHPNIATIYGVEESGGRKFLVMELVPGETLAERIKRGAIPLEEALGIAMQITEALEAAHEKGVIHRDLKPANIKTTPDGKVKVLDFGLAKAFAGETVTASLSNSPTISIAATQQGMILGTAAYMSPEQARGKDVDRRTDIFAFGAVLYEMLTGHQAFGGEDVSDILSRVLQREPDWTLLPANVPPRIRELLKLCLQKEAKKRRRDAGDVLIDISQVLKSPETAATPKVTRTFPWSWAAAAVLAVALGISLWAPWRTEPLKPLVRLEVDLGADVALPADAGQNSVILSPDGTRLVYIASVARAPSRLYTRQLDQTKATELPGTQGAAGPFFSPDSQWIGFFVGNKFNKISVEGSAVVPLTDVDILAGATWGEDGNILLGGVLTTGMRLLPPSGGPTANLTNMGSGEIAHGWPQFLPGGKFALFSVYQQTPNVDTVNLEAISLADAKRKVVKRGGTFPRYLPSGHLMYVDKSTLFAIPFNPDKLETSGNAVPILDDVQVNSIFGVPDLSFSNNGTLVYRKGGIGAASGQSNLQWIDAAGRRSPLMAKAGGYSNARLSPEGKRLAVQVTEGGSTDVWIYDIQRDHMTNLTFGGGVSNNPVWTPDGRFVIFAKAGGGIFWTTADGSGQPELLIPGKGVVVPWSMSLNGNGERLAFFEVGKAGGWISTVAVTQDGGALKAGKPERFFESRFVDVLPEYSPDGRWIAYMTNESGREEVVVRAYPAPASGQGGKWPVSTNGGAVVRWSRNSSELLYQEGDRIMAVSYTVHGDSFVADKPRVRLEKLGEPSWDLALDGRIAVVTPLQSAQAPAAEHTVVFLQNFFDYLRQRVPVSK
jgi:serine/threonine-protein kinase